MSDASGEPVILTTGLTKRYGSFTAVDSLDFSVTRGEIYGLLGPNGAGKTTTILMLLGLTEPSAGTARVEGHDPARDPLDVKARVGYLPDNVGFYANLTGRQNLRYTAALNRMKGKATEEHIESLLHDVGLADAADKRAGSYSRGMRQRLGIADALVKRPSILVLDEPTIGIDPEGVRYLLRLLHQLNREQGMTILLSSHLLHQVQEVCDRVGIFVGGRLIAAGPLATLERQLSQSADLEIEVRAITAAGKDLPGKTGPLSQVAVSAGDSELVQELSRTFAGLPRVHSAVLEQDMWVVRGKQDVRADMARVLAARSLLPVHLRLRSLSLDDIYDRYFREEVQATDGSN